MYLGKENVNPLPFFPDEGNYWRLDFYLHESFPSCWLPADTLIADYEGEKSPFTAAAWLIDKLLNFGFTGDLSVFKEKCPPVHPIEIASLKFDQADIIESFSEIDGDFTNFDHLDHYPLFDEVPADKFPLNMPIGGVYA